MGVAEVELSEIAVQVRAADVMMRPVNRTLPAMCGLPMLTVDAEGKLERVEAVAPSAEPVR
jgi:hypothetical protein